MRSSHIGALSTVTPNLADLLADALHSVTPHMADLPPWSIGHRCLEYHYTQLGRSSGRSTPCQSSIDALSTITSNLADLLADALSTVTPNMADLPPIEHRCLEDDYTKLGRSPSHWSIDHWMLYREICNLVSIGNLIYWEIQRLYCDHFRSLSLSL